MPIHIIDPTIACKRLDTIESGARRARLISHKRRIEQSIPALAGKLLPTTEVGGLVADHCLMTAALGVELRASGITERPTQHEVEYALRFGGFLS